MKKKFFGAVAGVALYSLSLATPIYFAEGHECCEPVRITLENFMDIKPGGGVYEYFNVVEEGIVVDEHIVVVKEPKFCDDGFDEDGNEYFFYIVDKGAGLKALITRADLTPCEKDCLDADVKEFASWVEDFVDKDGGVDSIIDRYNTD